MKTTLSALTIAAALIMNLTACTTDDIIVEETVQPTSTQGIHVTVGAGLGDGDGTTRAAVTQEGTTRTLTFTEGDRLYITEHLNDGGTEKFLAGYLDMVGSPSADGKSATFSGTPLVYLANGNSSSYDFGDADKLAVGTTEAFLVPAAAPAGFVNETDFTAHPINSAKMIAADVNTLMASAMYVRGSYNSSTKSFSLSGEKPILNCTIGHLSKNKEYTVKLRYANSQSNYESNYGVSETTYDGTVTTDDNGIARFAISGLNNIFSSTINQYYVLQLKRNTTTKEYVLGQKDLGAKVYNVKKDNYALCNFTVQMPPIPGTTYYENCDYFTVTVREGRQSIKTYSTQDEGMALTFNNGQVSFSFQMDPITDTTVTIMGTKTSSTGETYYGTIDNVTLEEFGTYNSPTVMLGRRKDLSAGSITAANDDYIFQSSNRESTGNTITIPNGVTVTIEGVNISPSGKAGINCEGNANIILKGSNSIQGGYGYPAVQGGCSGTTLTISGSGSLTATGGYGSAGIGSGHGGECGDIIISGGTGSATKGDSAPCSIGKGLACNTCGTIIIGTTVYPDGITISPFTWSITP